MERELKKFHTLYDVAIAMTADRTLEENLRLVVDRSRELLQADTAYIALRDEDRGDVFMHTLSGIRTEAFKKMRLPFGRGLGGLVAKTRRGYIVEDYFGEKGINHIVDRIVADEGVISGMAVPVQMGEENFGVLYIFNRRRTRFIQSDLDTLFLLGNLAALEISRKRAEEALHRVRAELEQRVIERTSALSEANEQLQREIEERMRSEEALGRSEERFRILIEKSPLGVSLIGKDGRYKYLNPKFTEMFGYDIRDISTGREWFEKAYPDLNYRRQVIGTWKKDSEGFRVGEVMPRLFVVTCKNGSERQISFRTVKMETGDRLIIYEDITEQRLLESRLQQSQKMEAIGTLAGGIAHDFNNLLMGIQGRASLMQAETDPVHPHFDHLKGIEQYVRSASDLTKQLLGFARGGKYEVQPCNLNGIISGTLEMFGRTKKEISIHRKLEEGLWPVEIDRGQIEQVLLNLYVNAWHAMPGGGDLHVETRNALLRETDVEAYDLQPGRYVRVTVTDSGVGMDEATRRRIFDPFFTTREMGRGTGLGLASAYGIISNHRGILDVQSKKGQGSSFRIYLPTTEKHPLGETKGSGDLLKGSGTILLVDDEDMIIEVGGEMIRKLGYDVLTARGGKEALEVYRMNRDRIRLVVLDMIMPEMGGGTTYEMLKEMDPGIRVILSSGYSIEGEAKQILDKGCNGFIQKPFNLKDLSRRIRDTLGPEE
ncbi:MAG: response regulator [Deltaproteobacteria bacterium]|nr:response regulator [Deltaproteobacteria bacterium]